MGKFFNDINKEFKPIIKNELALDFSFVPKVIPHREGEQQMIANAIKPLLQERNGKNLFIFGPPGVGKTVAVKNLLRELEEEFTNINVLYINCWENNTSYKVALKILETMNYKFVQNKNTQELLEDVARILNSKPNVLVFDEVDKLEDVAFLYFLLENLFKKTIILITNESDWLRYLDARVKSRLVAETIEFKPYSESEVRDILMERIKIALIPGSVDEEALDLLTVKTYLAKDIRVGIFLLRKSALIAEEELSDKITREVVLKASDSLDEFYIKEGADLSQEEQKILDIVGEGNKKIGELYEEYKSKGGSLSYKSFQRKIKKLAEKGFIETKRIFDKGNTTIVNRKLSEFLEPKKEKE